MLKSSVLWLLWFVNVVQLVLGQFFRLISAGLTRLFLRHTTSVCQLGVIKATHLGFLCPWYLAVSGVCLISAWSTMLCLSQYLVLAPSHPLDNIRVMVIVWRLGGNVIRTALCWIVWHNVHSPQHSYVSSSYRSNRLGLSHWDPAMRRGGCLELYYCNMLEWFWWDSSLICDDQLVSFSALTLLVWSSGV